MCWSVLSVGVLWEGVCLLKIVCVRVMGRLCVLCIIEAVNELSVLLWVRSM